MKKCTDCKYSEGLKGFEECSHPKNNIISNVDGRTKKRWMFCTTHREEPILLDILLHTCGKRARWFEPK